MIARALGFEPRSKVLETRMLPLHHARIKLKAIPFVAEQLLELFANIIKSICLQLKAFAFGLFDDFSYLTSTYCSTTFTNRKLKTLFHCDRLD